MLFLLLLIPILITIAILIRFTENINSIKLMLLGIEISIIGVALIALVGGGMSSSDGFIYSLVGLVIVLVGITTSIFGFIKK
ncbi:hypothetical protein [Clostridium sp. YIM B02551]|uniref:hypothetical protein n=1 Tax=Clostridium sp. YIM B02551 TaxID=2910679 RepID=UPI001EEC8E2A|nr:hypothetical protein [Clostridium sp. YIM B02551]